MTPLPDAVTVVLRDISATYPVPVHVEPIAAGGGNDVWITVDIHSKAGIRVADALAPAEQIADVADQVADWLVESLPGAGYPAVWPECPSPRLAPDAGAGGRSGGGMGMSRWCRRHRRDRVSHVAHPTARGSVLAG